MNRYKNIINTALLGLREEGVISQFDVRTISTLLDERIRIRKELVEKSENVYLDKEGNLVKYLDEEINSEPIFDYYDVPGCTAEDQKRKENDGEKDSI